MSSASQDRSDESASVLTPEQMTTGLWELCRKIGQDFHEEIRRVADEKGFKLDTEQDNTLWVEIIQLVIWIASFAIAGDRAVLDEFHQIYLQACTSSARTENERNQALPAP